MTENRPLFRFRGLGELEGAVMDLLGDRPAANALRTDPHGLSRSVGRGNVYVLQVRSELSAADATGVPGTAYATLDRSERFC